MFSQFITVMKFVFMNFVLPSWLVIFGFNLFADGAGITFHLAYNSLTFLGLGLIRWALPVTIFPKVDLIPFKDMKDMTDEEIEAEIKALDKKIKEAEKNGSSGPSDQDSK